MNPESLVVSSQWRKPPLAFVLIKIANSVYQVWGKGDLNTLKFCLFLVLILNTTAVLFYSRWVVYLVKDWVSFFGMIPKHKCTQIYIYYDCICNLWNYEDYFSLALPFPGLVFRPTEMHILLIQEPRCVTCLVPWSPLSFHKNSSIIIPSVTVFYTLRSYITIYMLLEIHLFPQSQGLRKSHIRSIYQKPNHCTSK